MLIGSSFFGQNADNGFASRNLVLVTMLIGFVSRNLVLVTMLIGSCILESGFGYNLVLVTMLIGSPGFDYNADWTIWFWLKC